MNKNLAKLQKIDLRDIWSVEPEFTNWLSQKENLELLSEEIGVDIKLIKTEANVGLFKVDILAEEESSGRKIIIENQLEDTNHDHLGKVITYASGYDAEIIVWVVRDIRDEHQRAIEWLNEHTDEKIGYFLIKIELWQIEGSNPAPKFEVLVAPNEWAKTIKASPAGGDLSDTKLQQLDFWTKFKRFVKANDTHIRLRMPRPQHWYNISMGSSEAHIALTINSRENLLGCEIYIDKNKELFKFLQGRSGEIEKEIGENEKVEWIDATVASRIKIEKKVSDVFSQNEDENYFAWLYQKTILLQKFFGKHLREFKQ
jgi:hypothetical protein